VNVAVIERELTPAERKAGWSHVYETVPQVTGRNFTIEPLPVDLTQNQGFAMMSRLSGYTFTLVPLVHDQR
jgi:hypothetical protein